MIAQRLVTQLNVMPWLVYFSKLGARHMKVEIKSSLKNIFSAITRAMTKKLGEFARS